jgi:hypothetical protein
LSRFDGSLFSSPVLLWRWVQPPNHLLLDSAPSIGPLIFRWELDKFKSCWNKCSRTSRILTLLYQQFSNLLISQRDMSGPRLGALSTNRWLEAILLSYSLICQLSLFVSRCQILFLVHLILSVWWVDLIKLDMSIQYGHFKYEQPKNQKCAFDTRAGQDGWMPNAYLYYNFIYLLLILWSIHYKESEEPVMMVSVMSLTVIL